MAARWRWWDRLREQLLTPQIADDELAARLADLRRQLPIPVFWLLGKAQSGKTSLVRALTGAERATIGNGFRACTRTSQVYDFPDADHCWLRFLDTRGLGEVDYDPAEDLAQFQQQAHLLIVVVKALDQALEPVLGPLAVIRRAHPQWPLIVAQSCLHEGYPPSAPRHPLPYPYLQGAIPAEVPAELARAMSAQRTHFTGPAVRFVPVDFTLPEDGFEPEHYGLEALWQAIEELLPWGLRGLLRQDPKLRAPWQDAHYRAARSQVMSYALAAAAAAALPVPLVDVPLVVAIQAKMFHAVARIYRQPLSAARLGEISSTLGLGYLLRWGGRELLKWIPGLGSVMAGTYIGATTYALGCTLCVYFSQVQQGDLPDAARLGALYEQEFASARQHLGRFLRGGEARSISPQGPPAVLPGSHPPRDASP